MSKFRTSIPSISFPFSFHHELPVLGIGSCFAEHIGAKLAKYKFPVQVNPSGIQYNPYSIGNTLEMLLQAKTITSEDLFENNGLWHSFDHHSHFSNPDKTLALQMVNDQLEAGHLFLKSAKRLILSFGSSNVFIYKETQKVVSNCHKVPNHQFERKALSIEQIIKKLRPLFLQLKNSNPELEILLTVSPVRHIRDGLIENQRSKARLLLACEALCETFDYAHYFPSYELLMDELRDYRFYTEDMIHPTPLAIDHIWEYFSQSFFNTETKHLNSKIEKIINAISHRPFHQESMEHQAFVNKQLNLIKELSSTSDFLVFEEEAAILKNQLIKPK